MLATTLLVVADAYHGPVAGVLDNCRLERALLELFLLDEVFAPFVFLLLTESVKDQQVGVANQPIQGNLYRQIVIFDELRGLLEHFIPVVFRKGSAFAIDNWLEGVFFNVGCLLQLLC